MSENGRRQDRENLLKSLAASTDGSICWFRGTAKGKTKAGAAGKEGGKGPKHRMNYQIIECDYCPMKYHKWSAFYVHRCSHTGETPVLPCGVCDMEFPNIKGGLAVELPWNFLQLQMNSLKLFFSTSFSRSVYLSLIFLMNQFQLKRAVSFWSNAEFQLAWSSKSEFWSDRNDFFFPGVCSALKEHKTTAHPSAVFQCDQCERSFLSRSALLMHRPVHSTKLNFQCRYCQVNTVETQLNTVILEQAVIHKNRQKNEWNCGNQQDFSYMKTCFDIRCWIGSFLASSVLISVVCVCWNACNGDRPKCGRWRSATSTSGSTRPTRRRTSVRSATSSSTRSSTYVHTWNCTPTRPRPRPLPWACAPPHETDAKAPTGQSQSAARVSLLFFLQFFIAIWLCDEMSKLQPCVALN